MFAIPPVLFISFVIALQPPGFFLSDKNNNPPHPLPVFETDKLFNETPTTQTELVKSNFQKIHGYLKDSLYDQDEGEIMKIINESKRDSTLNQLIYKLDASGLLKNLAIRWDEQNLSYQSPGLLDEAYAKISGNNLSIRPIDNFYESNFFNEIFSYTKLDKDAGRKVLSAFRYRIGLGDFKGSSDSEGLQYLALNVVIDSVTSISPGTKELFIEVFTDTFGRDAFVRNMDAGRRILGMKTSSKRVKASKSR